MKLFHVVMVVAALGCGACVRADYGFDAGYLLPVAAVGCTPRSLPVKALHSKVKA